MGLDYMDGLGIEKDLAKAKKWLQKVSAQGFEPAQKALKKLDATGK